MLTEASGEDEIVQGYCDVRKECLGLSFEEHQFLQIR